METPQHRKGKVTQKYLVQVVLVFGLLLEPGVVRRM